MSAAPRLETRDDDAIRDGIAYIPTWGWDSTKDTLFGYPVRADVYPAIRQIPDGKLLPSIYLTFTNEWVVTLGFIEYIQPTPAEYVATVVAASTYSGVGNRVREPASHRDLGLYIDLRALEAPVREVAQLPSWGEPQSTIADEELIARYITPNPMKSGKAEYWLDRSRIPVWAVIGQWQAESENIAETAAAFHLTLQEVAAVLAFYRHYPDLIDDRLARNRIA